MFQEMCKGIFPYFLSFNSYHNPKHCGALFVFYRNENGSSEMLSSTAKSLKDCLRNFSQYLSWIIIYGLNHLLVNLYSNIEKIYQEQDGFM